MATATYDNEADFTGAVRARLGTGLPPDILDQLADSILQGEHDWRAVPPRLGETALNLRIGRFFIRDDDLPVIEAIGASASAVIAMDPNPHKAIAGFIPVITALATAAWNLWRKGVLLSREDMVLLGLLRALQSAKPQDLLDRSRAAGVDLVDVTAVQARLRKLTRLETRDGTELRLAEEANGLWAAAPL